MMAPRWARLKNDCRDLPRQRSGQLYPLPISTSPLRREAARWAYWHSPEEDDATEEIILDLIIAHLDGQMRTKALRLIGSRAAA